MTLSFGATLQPFSFCRPPEVEAVLADPRIRGLLLHCTNGEWQHGVSVVVLAPHQDVPRTLTGWAEIKALGVAGMAEAMVALQQPHPLSTHALQHAWIGFPNRGKRNSPIDLALCLVAGGTWIASTNANPYRLALDTVFTLLQDPTTTLDTLRPAVQALPLASIATFLDPPLQTAHERLAHAPIKAQALDALFDVLPHSLTRQALRPCKPLFLPPTRG